MEVHNLLNSKLQEKEIQQLPFPRSLSFHPPALLCNGQQETWNGQSIKGEKKKAGGEITVSIHTTQSKHGEIKLN